MQAQITQLKGQVDGIIATQHANHEQNRADIHRLFNGQQDIVDALTRGMDKIGDKIAERCNSIEKDVISIRLKLAKAAGYAAGVAALGAIVFELVKFAMERTVTK